MKKILTMASMALLLNACGNKETEYDATGVFEATETTVFAEQSGTLMTFDINEGDNLIKNKEVALVDTTQLWLEIKQTKATKNVYQSQKPEKEKQIAATQRQLDNALQEQQRYKELVADGAAPQKTLDDATNQVEVLKKQLEAQMSSLTISTNALDEQANVADKQKDRLLDRLNKCHIYAPTNGTVTEKYVERGEYVSVGKPLFKMADIQTMFLRAYITSSQLKNIKLDQKATVYADYGNNSKKEYEGRVCWISSRSEFTPKTIVTDDERADLVYALKIEIKNDGYAKIGMYGEVKFK